VTLNTNLCLTFKNSGIITTSIKNFICKQILSLELLFLFQEAKRSPTNPISISREISNFIHTIGLVK